MSVFLAWIPAVLAAPTLTMTGACPGPLDIEITGLIPHTEVAFLLDETAGSATIPAGSCAGSDSGLDKPRLVHRQTDTDGDGILRLYPDVGASLCGELLTAVDLGSCERTNSAPIGAGATEFLTYLGGSSNGNFGLGTVRDTAVDDSGNLYVAGGISVAGYGTADAAQQTFGGGDVDAFVASFAPDGTLRFFTYLGGPNHDRVYGMSVDDFGITIGGRAGDGFPVTADAAQASFSGGADGEYGPQDAFVARLSVDGSTLEWATYLGGPGEEICRDVDAGPDGTAWCAMAHVDGPEATLDGFAGALAGSFQGGGDAALVHLSSDGQTMLHATYVGGSGPEPGAPAVHVTSNGGVAFAVPTESDDAPITSGAAQTTRGGSTDVLLLSFNPDYSLAWGTYYGGSGIENSETHSIGVGDDDTVYVGMYSDSAWLPGAVNTNPGSSNGFIARIAADGSSVLAARYIGGSGFDEVEGVSVRGGLVAVSGGTDSWDFPTTADAFAPSQGGFIDGQVQVMTSDLSAVVYASYIPSTEFTFGHSVALGPAGELLTGGSTDGSDLPTLNAFEPTLSSGVPTSGSHVDPTWDAGYVYYQP